MADNKFEIEKYPEYRSFVKDLDNLPGYPMSPPASDWAYYGGNREEDDKIHLREYLRRIRRHKWLVMSLVVIVTTLVTIQVYRTKPWYTASTVLEVGKENSMVLKSGDVTLNDDSDPNYLVNINTKRLALDSPDLIEKVVVDQKLDTDPKFIEKINRKPLFSLSGLTEPKEAPKAAPSPGQTDKAFEESVRLGPFVRELQKNIVVEQIKNTRALKVSYTDEDPQQAANVANSIVKIFRQLSFDTQTEKFTNSVEWLDNSTRELKAKVESSEEELAKYTRENQIYSTDSGANDKGDKAVTLTTSKLIQLHDQFIRTQTERMLKKSLYEQVQAGRIAELPEAFSDPKITQYQQQLATLQTQASELKVKLGPANPKIQEVQNQIATLTSQIEKSRKELEAKLKADYERAVKDEQSLDAALNTAKSAAVNENQASIRYNILKQDVETARGLYTDFLQKTNQAKAQVAEQNNNIKVIQQAHMPTSPVGPQRLVVILAGFFFSLAGGIGLALFLEYLDNTIKSLEDVERYAQLPTLGVIPAISLTAAARLRGRRSRKQIAVADDGSQLGLERKKNAAQVSLMTNLDKDSMAGEAYRGLRTSLLLSSAGTPPKTILVTSGRAGEGKSTTAVNTAISLAQLGAKVLIIDCDLRRPSVHKFFDISNAHGVTNYLANNTDIGPLIQSLAIPNLSVIPSGPIPPNPAELLSSSKMKDLLEQLSSAYDHVIIDSPPIINVTDPIILSTLVDGTMMIVHAGKTTREVVQRSRQDLFNVRSKIFGIVLNNVNLRKDGYDYYYYYRYSDYKLQNGASSN